MCCGRHGAGDTGWQGEAFPHILFLNTVGVAGIREFPHVMVRYTVGYWVPGKLAAAPASNVGG